MTTQEEIQELHRQIDLIGTTAYELRVKVEYIIGNKHPITRHNNFSLKNMNELKRCKINHGKVYVAECIVTKTDIFQERINKRLLFTDKADADRQAKFFNENTLHALGIG